MLPLFTNTEEYLEISKKVICGARQICHKFGKNHAFIVNWKDQYKYLTVTYLFVLIISKMLPLCTKAELLLLKLIDLFARDVLLVKKLEGDETKTTKFQLLKLI